MKQIKLDVKLKLKKKMDKLDMTMTKNVETNRKKML